MGLLDWITEKAKAQYAKGEPYRQAAMGLLQGDMGRVNQALSKSDLTPMDFALMMGINPIKGNIPEYLYHGTSEGAFRKIRNEGLNPVTPMNGENLGFLSSDIQNAKSYAERKGNPFGERLLRVKNNNFEPDTRIKSGVDYIFKKNISPENIEMLWNNKWMPIQSYYDEAINIPKIK